MSREVPLRNPSAFSFQGGLPTSNEWEDFTDEDFISYGIMPELVGRIAKMRHPPYNGRCRNDLSAFLFIAFVGRAGILHGFEENFCPTLLR